MIDVCHYIYILKDPRDNAVRYVGLSYDLVTRYNAHLHTKMDAPRDRWIAELRALGLKPLLQQVDCHPISIANPRADRAAAQRLESLWINHLIRLGMPLLNVHKRNDRRPTHEA